MSDPRIDPIREAIAKMKDGEFHFKLPKNGDDTVALLGNALEDLAKSLNTRFDEMRMLIAITERINSGVLLDEILNYVFESFRPMIPYDRIGFSIIEDNGKTVRARWARSDVPVMEISRGYAAKLAGSSLQTIIETGHPRVINDLEQYLRDHPDSDSTKRIVKEGIRSSLTCPLIAMGKPIGFMFFSSRKPFTYDGIHTEMFLRIASQLSVIVEKGRYLEQVLELSHLRNKFLGMAVHDLRNPISVIDSYVEFIKEGALGPVTDEQQEALADMKSASSSMMALLEDILDISAIENGILQLKTKRVNVGDYLKMVAASNKIRANAKSISITVVCNNPQLEVTIDPDRIGQMLDNLISNAIKYSHKGSNVIIQAERIDDELKISVIDQGQGIPQDELPVLFKDFSKTSVRPTAGEKSTGLGLAIVRRIAEAHGGRAQAESVVGKGSTFSVFIPMK